MEDDRLIPKIPLDDWVETARDFLKDNLQWLFDGVKDSIEEVDELFKTLLHIGEVPGSPFILMIIIALIACWVLGLFSRYFFSSCYISRNCYYYWSSGRYLDVAKKHCTSHYNANLGFHADDAGFCLFNSSSCVFQTGSCTWRSFNCYILDAADCPIDKLRDPSSGCRIGGSS